MNVTRTARRYLALTALSLLATALPAPAVAQDDDDDRPVRREEFKWAGQIAPGQTVEVKGVNGGIEAERSPSGQVEIVAVKSGRRSDPRAVAIKVVPHAEGVTICSVYPSVDDEPNECLPGKRGRNNTRNNDVKVSFTVRVPAGSNFIGRTVNGAIEARDLDGRVEATTVNGSIRFNTEGTGAAKTVNGSIDVKLGRSDWTDTLELETVNGSIELALPAGVDADVEARTVNGRINSALPLTLQEMTRRSLKGTLGSGGRALSLGTVNGSITLKPGA